MPPPEPTIISFTVKVRSILLAKHAPTKPVFLPFASYETDTVHSLQQLVSSTLGRTQP